MRARLHDIVFTLRLMPNSRDAAEQAARAYLDCVGGSLQVRHQGAGLVRAWTMTRKVGMVDLEREIVTAMIAMVEQALDRAERNVLKDVAALVRKRAGNDAALVDRANRRHIGALLTEAQAAKDPTIIRAVVADAASVARQLGVADLEKAAVAGLQSAPALDWDSTRVSSTSRQGGL